jgi:cyclohexanecarboxylate-CoA ligase
VCVTAQRYDGMEMAATLAEVAPETLRHRVVVGTGPAAVAGDLGPAAGGTDAAAGGTIDFTGFFVDTPWERRHEVSPRARRTADEVAVLLFTSGTTGQPKCIAHTSNTLCASVRSVTGPYGLGPDEVITIPHYLTHMAGCSLSIYMSIVLGGTCVMQDDRDMGLLLDMVEAHRVTFVYTAPMFVQLMIEAQGKQARDISSLRTLVSGSSPLPPALIATARDTFGVELYALWGMTENGGVTVTRPTDPPGWAAHSDGRPEPWMQARIAYEPDTVTAPGEAPFGRLLVRGASQCLGYLNVPEAYAACLDEDGWFDTGDMARDDGRGGIRITGRRTDLIIKRNAMKVPTAEVEGVIMTHPRVADVALIGYPDPEVAQTELVCAFVVADGEPPTLAELRAYLRDQQMTPYNWPDRVDVVPGLPKNSLGKVQREQLRDRIAGRP